MNWITVKGCAALLAGCVLAQLTGLAAAVPPSEGEASSGEAAATRERYQVYGLSEACVGECWTHLGSYDSAKDAHAAGEDACRPQEGERPFTEYRVVRAAGLALPPSVSAWRLRSLTIYRLSADDHGERLVGRYDTAREAEAAAEKVLAAGDRFQVVYWWR